MLDEDTSLEQRVNRLLGDEKLKGGALGFISSMLFLANSEKNNIYNSNNEKTEEMKKLLAEYLRSFPARPYGEMNLWPA